MRKILLALLLTCGACPGSEYTQYLHQFEDTTIVQRHYPILQSTQTTILDHMKDVKANQWVEVTTNEQTEGIGNWGRSWISPPNNVFVTYAIPRPDIKQIKYVSSIAGVVVCKVLQDYGFNPQLRWPNNILIGDEKIGGILCTGPRTGEQILFIGIGINVSMDKETALTIDQPVTSLKIKLDTPPSVDEVMLKLREKFYPYFRDASTFPAIIKEYDPLLAYKGKTVTIRTDKDGPYFEGIFTRITSEGFLMLLMNGQEKQFASGEIVPFNL